MYDALGVYIYCVTALRLCADDERAVSCSFDDSSFGFILRYQRWDGCWQAVFIQCNIDNVTAGDILRTSRVIPGPLAVTSTPTSILVRPT